MRQGLPHDGGRPKKNRVVPEAIRIPKEIIEELLLEGHIRYDSEMGEVDFFDVSDQLEPGKARRFDIVWDHLVVKGKASIQQSHVMRGRKGKLRDVFRRKKVFKVLIFDGCGNVYFRWPEEILKRARAAMRYRLLDAPPESEEPPSPTTP